MREFSYLLIEEFLERAIEKRRDQIGWIEVDGEQMPSEEDVHAEWEGTRLADLSTEEVIRALEELREQREEIVDG